MIYLYYYSLPVQFETTEKLKKCCHSELDSESRIIKMLEISYFTRSGFPAYRQAGRRMFTLEKSGAGMTSEILVFQ
jgi:hypothetical protein